MEFGINLLPVIIIAVLYMPLGAFIYSPKGLGKQWLEAIDKTEEDIKNDDSNMGMLMGIAFASSFITVFILGVLIKSLMIDSILNLGLLLLMVYIVVLVIRLKSSVFDGNIKLFKVNLTGTFLEFVIAFIVFMFFI